MKKEIICTVCPTGCLITVEGDENGIVSIEGFTCPRGKAYGESEFLSPVRILTSTVKTDSEKTPLLAVRSRTPVPKKSLFDCMEKVRGITVKAPVKRGDVIISDICGTGVDLIAAGDLK